MLQRQSLNVLHRVARAGSYFQATYLAGTLYERAMRITGQTGSTCRGAICFRDVFLINAGLAGAALATSALLWRRTRYLYAKVIAVTKAERARRGLQVQGVPNLAAHLPCSAVLSWPAAVLPISLPTLHVCNAICGLPPALHQQPCACKWAQAST
jgi:hypothetical protein